MSVTGYAEKIKNMDVYSRKVVYASYEKWKVDQFMYGLRVEIAPNVSQREFTTYADLLRRCYVVKNNLKRVQEEIDQYMFGQKDQVISLSLSLNP